MQGVCLRGRMGREAVTEQARTGCYGHLGLTPAGPLGRPHDEAQHGVLPGARILGCLPSSPPAGSGGLLPGALLGSSAQGGLEALSKVTVGKADRAQVVHPDVEWRRNCFLVQGTDPQPKTTLK